MNVYLGFVLVLCSMFGLSPQSGGTPKVAEEDVQALTGAQWKGALTYLDYGTKKRVSIPSNLNVTRGEGTSWTFEYLYPDEPKANSKSTIALEDSGRMFDGEKVIERTSAGPGSVKIVTEQSGPDDDKPALFRFTYLIGAKSFSIKKEVRYEGTSEFIERNRYEWTR